MNVGRKPAFVIDQDCIAVTNRIIREVEKAGLQAMRSFDLDAVRTSNKGFYCPIHGTNSCTCHLVVLLILLRDRGTITLILEGSDQQTAVYLDSGQGASEEMVDPSLTAALTHAFFQRNALSGSSQQLDA